MVEATCLWVWEFTTHNHLDLWANDEDPHHNWSSGPGWDAPHVWAFWENDIPKPLLLCWVGMSLGSPYDWVKARITYAYSGSRQTWYQSRTVCRTIKPWSMSSLAFYKFYSYWGIWEERRLLFSPYPLPSEFWVTLIFFYGKIGLGSSMSTSTSRCLLPCSCSNVVFV